MHILLAGYGTPNEIKEFIEKTEAQHFKNGSGQLREVRLFDLSVHNQDFNEAMLFLEHYNNPKYFSDIGVDTKLFFLLNKIGYKPLMTFTNEKKVRMENMRALILGNKSDINYNDLISTSATNEHPEKIIEEDGDLGIVKL